MPKAMTLMNDVFGNYVIQKVLELGPDEHREELAQLMKGHVSGTSGAGWQARGEQLRFAPGAGGAKA